MSDHLVSEQNDPSEPSDQIDRRSVLRAVGVGSAIVAAAPLLSACGGTSSAGGGATAVQTQKVPVASVPLGSGVIADGTVVVQPTAGTFLAFDGTCPHQGCTVSRIESGLIVCGCHGSRFSIKDGSVQQGPAQQGLAKRSASVSGDQVVIG